MKTPEDEEGWHLEIMLMGSQENRRGELWKNTAPAQPHEEKTT